MPNPFKYTSRTYESLLSDINNSTELVDKPDWFKDLIAGLGDVISMWNNATANNTLLGSAFTRRAVQMLLDLIDYQMAPQTTSSGILIFYLNDSVVFPITVQKEDIVGLTAGTTAVSSKRFEARNSVTVTDVNESIAPASVNIGTDIITVTRDFKTGEKVRWTSSGTLPAPLAIDTDYYVIRVSATEIKLATTLTNALSGTQINITTQGTGTHNVKLYSFQATCYQQTQKDSEIIGESDGLTKWQEFDLPDFDILKDTLEIVINSVTWTRVDSWIDSASVDKHFKLIYNSDNSAKIQFGDGTYGVIPSAFDIYAAFATGGNSDSNVTTSNKVNIYAGGDSNVNGVSHSNALTGGGDPEPIDTAKIIAPLLLKARDRFVTASDGEALALNFGGSSQVKIIENAYGVLSVRVLTIALGGGNLSPAVQAELQTYLINRTILESIDVRVEDTTITPVNVTSAGKVLSGYTWASTVENNFRMGWKLFLTETGKEIQADYISNGVDSARVKINTLLSESFDATYNTQVQEFLDNLDPRTIGEDDIQDSDVKGFLDAHTIGLDYLTITAPTFPYSLLEDEITTVGTLTLTEIP
jgi:hypothetical protein